MVAALLSSVRIFGAEMIFTLPSVSEAWIWALVYLYDAELTALPDLQAAFYFSMVTFTFHRHLRHILWRGEIRYSGLDRAYRARRFYYRAYRSTAVL